MEGLPEKRFLLSEEEEFCENHFKSTYRINDQGRFVVRLPVYKDINQLGDTKRMAVSRLLTMEKKFKFDSEFQREYKGFMSEYEELGHMSPNKDFDSSKPDYFLPHHAVQKKDKKEIILHGFSDASESAYACVIYALQRSDNGVTKVTILAAKSIVAPLKSILKLFFPGCLHLLEIGSPLLPTGLQRSWTSSFKIDRGMCHQRKIQQIEDPEVCFLRIYQTVVYGGRALLSYHHQRLIGQSNQYSKTMTLSLRKGKKLHVFRSNMSKQKMGDLPEGRVTLNRPFFVCGIDYAGPISILKHRGRGAKTTKDWTYAFYMVRYDVIMVLKNGNLLLQEVLCISFRSYRNICLFSYDESYPIKVYSGHSLQANTRVRFHPNGVYFASASTDGNVFLFKVTVDSYPVRMFHKHKTRVYALAFSPCGRCLASTVYYPVEIFYCVEEVEVLCCLLQASHTLSCKTSKLLRNIYQKK
ncbi:TAF5-like RNA polymerase II [Argiope bruennichi]|uniref:TAF5-like RNA polymerase II n=1 Tax=Argiope bruennichi TaxID=94029 RepID=A0A8T0F9F1_ARGBR|nr:TAF5-like RNA polymerase II [Argiope bruennichi]